MSIRRWTVALALGGALLLGCSSEDAPTSATAVSTSVIVTPNPTAPAVTATATARLDGAAVVRAFIDAINRGDGAAAEALLRPNATWERGGQCPPGACIEASRWRQEIERDIANRHRMDIATIASTGDTVTARVELQTNGTRAANVARIVQIFTVAVSDAKIAAIRIANDLTDPVTAAFAGERGRAGN